jgi:hypothetical protein
MRALRFGDVIRRRELNRRRRDGCLLAHCGQRAQLLRMGALATLMSVLHPRKRCRAVRLRRLH